MRHFLLFLVTLCGCALIGMHAHAITVSVMQPLNFGTWLITNNSSDYTVAVGTDGSFSNSPQLIMIRPPQKGIYNLSDLPLSTAITSIDVTQGQPLTGTGGEVLTMDDFVTDASSSTDMSGHLQLTLGATAHTSGSGSGYGHGVFTGQINVEINY